MSSPIGSSNSSATGSPTAQQLVDGLLLTALGTTAAGNVLHATLGSMIGMLLVGVVTAQLVRYCKMCDGDPTWLKVFAGVNAVITVATSILNIMNNVQLLKNYGTYSRWFRNDIVFRCSGELTLGVIHGPAAFYWYGLKSWALNGRSRVFAAIGIFFLFSYMACGITGCYYGMTVPLQPNDDPNVSLTWLIMHAEEMEQWKANTLRSFQVWGCMGVAMGTTLIGTIVFGLFRNRTGSARDDKPLYRLCYLNIECILPVTIVKIADSVLLLMDNGFGGWLRLFDECVPALFTHAIIHALLVRKEIELMLQARKRETNMSQQQGIPDTFITDYTMYSTDYKSDLAIKATEDNKQYNAFRLYAVWDQPMNNKFVLKDHQITLGSTEVPMSNL